jgi:hypothetical protein
MAKNIYGNDQSGSPFSWQAGDTSTFANQADNLAKQAGDAGLNTGQIQVQNETAKAEQKAGESGQNVAAGSDQVAQGAQVSPDVAQGDTPPPLNPDGSSNTKIQPYVVTKEAPAAPDTNVTPNTDFSGNSTYQDPTQAYLASLFPNGIPDSIQSAMDKSLNNSGNDQNGLIDSYNQYLKGLQTNINDQANNSQDLLQYQNYLKNQFANQQQGLNQTLGSSQNDLATQLSDKQKGVSDYINNLQQGLKDYQDRTKDLSNIGQLSPAEIAAAAQNGVLANAKSGSEALSALAQHNVNSKLGALSQQAESAAINQAQGQAQAAQQNAKTGEQIQAAGQKAQANSYTKAGDTINKNQTDTLNKLNQNGTDAQKALSDAYNNANTNLTKQEQDYVNKAQDTLKNAKIPETTIKDATNAFANSVKSYVDKGNLSDTQKSNLKTQLESIWRIAVGSNPSDMNFSNDIAGTLLPILQSLGESNFTPYVSEEEAKAHGI